MLSLQGIRNNKQNTKPPPQTNQPKPKAFLNWKLTCTFYQQFLPMAAQKSPRQKGSKIHKNLSQKRGSFFQSVFKPVCNASREREEIHHHRKTKRKEVADIL